MGFPGGSAIKNQPAYTRPRFDPWVKKILWSGLPFPSPEDLPNPGFKPRSPGLQEDALRSEPPGKPSLGSPSQSTIASPLENSIWQRKAGKKGF